MSRRKILASAIREKISMLKGAHLTREARIATAEKFASAMSMLQYTHLKSPEDIKAKHLRDFVNHRKKQGAQIRTVQNEMSHLRAVLRACGKKDLVDAPEMANRALQISGGSRVGRKAPLTDDQLYRVYERSIKQRRPGMGCILMLERHLGLRGNEAIHARADTLKRWKKELETTSTIKVIAGTKGGRPRMVNIPHADKARAAIDEALIVACAQGGFLVVRKNGQPAGGLHQARAIYHAWMNRAGVQPHAARYAFARTNFDAYRIQHCSSRESLMQVSGDLGHGSGRGRWVKSVYMKGIKADVSQ